MFSKLALHLGKRHACCHRNCEVARIVLFNLVQARGAEQNVNALRHSANLLPGHTARRRNHKTAFVRQPQNRTCLLR